MKTKIVLMILSVFALLPADTFAQRTVRTPRAGGGYTEVTTDRHGRDIQVTRTTEDGKVIDSIETNPETGERTETNYDKDGNPESRSTTNRDGITTKSEITDAQGRGTDTQTFNDDGEFESHTTTEYDESGRVTRTQTLNDSGEVVEETGFMYREDGTLENAERRKRNAAGDLEVDGQTFYDEDGKLVETMGNVGGITDGLPGQGGVERPSNRSVYTDPSGITFEVIHNPDGSCDVIARDRHGRIISLQYYATCGTWPHEDTLQHLRNGISNNITTVSQAVPDVMPETQNASIGMPGGAAVAYVNVMPDDSFVFASAAVAVTTVGEVQEIEAGEKVPAENILWASLAGGWRVIKPVASSVASGAIGAYIGTQAVGGQSEGAGALGEAASFIPVAQGRTPLISSYNPAGAEHVSMTMPAEEGLASVRTYMEPLVEVQNPSGLTVGQVGTAAVDPKALGTGSVRMETYDSEGNVTGQTEPLGSYRTAEINLQLDASPVAGQPGILTANGLEAASYKEEISTVTPAGQDENLLLKLEYTGGLTGPETMPVTGNMDSMVIPVQYPLNPGEVGVSGYLIYPQQEVPSRNADGSVSQNPAMLEIMTELQGGL